MSIMDEISKLKSLLADAKRIPFSKYVSVDREELLATLSRIEVMLPNEVKEAFIVNAKKDEILKEAYKKSDEIINFAKEREQEILSESSIMQIAQKEREKIISEAVEEANAIRREAAEYVTQLFDKIESVIEKVEEALMAAKKEFKDDITGTKNP